MFNFIGALYYRIRIIILGIQILLVKNKIRKMEEKTKILSQEIAQKYYNGSECYDRLNLEDREAED